jgi:Na+/melibiose symporter-like transporter
VTEHSSIALLVRVGRARELRRVLVAYAGFSVSEYATWLAVLFYALERGGPQEVGLVAFLQLVPAVVITPFAAYAGDRFRPQRALAAGYAVQSAAMIMVAVAMLSGQSLLAYSASALATAAISFTRPVMGCLLPTLTHRPADLIAANVVAGTIQQAGVFIGPLLAGVVMASGSPAQVFIVGAVVTGLGCLAVVVSPVSDGEPDEEPGDVPDLGDLRERLLAGFGTLRRESRVRVLVGMIAVAGLVNGVADVLVVTFTDERLEGGGGLAGLLAAAYGLGGVLGVVAVARFVRSTQVGRALLWSAAVAGGALVLMASTTGVGSALLLFAVLGSGETFLALAASVTIQRQAPTAVLARVFGIVEGAQMAAVAVGGLLVTLLVTRLTVSASFVVLGFVTFGLVVIGVWRLRRSGAGPPPVDAAIIDLLVADPIFAALPAPTMERLGRTVRRQPVPADTAIVRQGEDGNHYFVIADGEFSVTKDGENVNHLASGRSFGEIALLRDVPRTSTVTALTDAELLVIDRDDFLEAVTGHPRSHTTARAIADGHIGPVDS